MTLPSRRKRPITAPTTLPARKAINGRNHVPPASPGRLGAWLTLGFACVLPLTASGQQSYSISDDDAAPAAPLRWRKPQAVAAPAPKPAATIAQAGGTASGGNPIRLVSGQLSITPAFEHEVEHAVVSEPVAPPRPGAPASSSTGGWNKTRIDGSVRQVQATSDPFRDPFGDRYAQRPGPTFTQQPAAPGAPDPGALPPPPAPAANPNIAPPAFDLPNPANPAAPAPMPAEPANPAAPAPFAPAPAPAPAPTDPAIPENTVRPGEDPLQFQPPNRIRQVPMDNAPAPQPAPPPSGAEPMPRRGRMSSTYNELECGQVDQNCQAFIKRLMADKLANISLDITPRYMPDPDLDPAEAEMKRDDQLKQAESRDWKDAAGQVLASGRLLRLENGDAVIGEQGAETARVPLRQLGDDELCFIAGWYRLPAECILRDTRKDVALLRDNRQWLASTYTWHASALCHKPLYFEEAQLERYGHTAGRIRQPLLSGAHFFGSMILLPYQMAISPPWECEYSLGYYRPGSCAPWHLPPFPFSPKAALTQAGVVVGGIMIVP